MKPEYSEASEAPNLAHAVMPEEIPRPPHLSPDAYWPPLAQRLVAHGVTSPNGNLCTLRVPQGSQVSLDDVLAEIPNVVTREIDVLPAQRG